jgi:hypothetical protein
MVFVSYRGINEVTPLNMLMTFLIIRFIAEAFIVSPNNLATLQALPENKVYMATALSGLLRSIANTMGTSRGYSGVGPALYLPPPAVR